MVMPKTDSIKTAEDARFVLAIADELPGLFAYWDNDMRCRFANCSYLEWFGKAPEEVIGKTILDLMGEQLFALNEPHIHAALAGTPQKFERTLTKADGSIGYTLANYIPDVNEQGVTEGFIALVTDVTLLKQSQLELQQSEAHLRAILDNSPYLTWLKDTEGRYLSINRSFADFLRLGDPLQAYGKTDLDLQPQELAEKYRADDVEVMSIRKRKHLEESAFDGNRFFWVESFKTPVIDAQGNVLGTVGMARDITERKFIENELRIASVAFNTQEAMMITDAKSVIVKVNRAFTESTGYSSEEAVGKKPSLLKSGRHEAEFYRAMWDCVHNTGKWQGEIWDRRKNGEEYPKWLTISAVKDSAGTVTNYVGSHFDITERKIAENKMPLLNFEWVMLYAKQPMRHDFTFIV